MADPVRRELERLIQEWLEADPDPVTRAEVEALVAADDAAELEDRFGQRIVFGTAGIRGARGAGPNRMNRVVIRRMAAGVAAHLGPDTTVVIGYDARHQSDVFAADAAAVLASHGIEAKVLPTETPTPVLAFAVRDLGADLGLMVTASHNPPGDNGCKVFLADGAQLRAPFDEAIDRLIASAPLPPRLLTPADGLVVELDGAVIDRYVAAMAATVPTIADPPPTAYTPLHGVGWAVLRRVFADAGLAEPAVVAEQLAPDPDFPTVAFPNPEEPGAMDGLLAVAQSSGAAIAIANDPDADRLCIALPDAQGGWRVLTGDELGVLLADHMLSVTAGDDRKVVSTVVCSSMVSKVARAAGAVHAETLTGFKWIMAEAYADPTRRPVFAYEESLGYALTESVRDKDGISAALRFIELTAALRARGVTPLDRLAELSVEHGVHATRSFSIRFDGPGAVTRAADAVERLRADPPSELAGRAVQSIADYIEGDPLPPTNLLRFDLEGGLRMLVRPSGTEPKTKVYLELVVPCAAAADVWPVHAEALAELDGLRPAIESLLAT